MMAEQPRSRRNTARARSLRENQTRSEGLLWRILRGRQLCGLKFRRQHPIGPWITDFACCENLLVVAIDGGYHEETAEQDITRQKNLQSLASTVIRFMADDVEQDAEAVSRAIAQAMNVPYQFTRRKANGSGMKRKNAAGKSETK